MPRLRLLGLGLDDPKHYYYVALGVLLLAMLFARRVWITGVGRRYRAVRDNESAARAYGLSSTRVKLEAFALAGGLAGVGGAVFAHNLSVVSVESFPLNASINAAAIAALGGLSLVSGSIVGALYIIAVPAFVPLDAAGLAATSLGWLFIVVRFPGGIAQAVAPVRDRLARRMVSAAAGPEAEEGAQGGEAVALRIADADRALADGERTWAAPAATARTDGCVLRAKGMTKRYGGLLAVDHVSLELQQGETLGLIGPNGAGKTTLFELMSGFNQPDEGTVEFLGRDITGLNPEQRARRGLCRSFQDARLFPTLSVMETVQVALERRWPTAPAPTILGFSKAEAQRTATARDLVGLLGLERYADNQIAQLSTGTRRVVELACVLALEPRVVLLDEPTSGIAQRETEALAGLLQSIKGVLGISLVVIEHDIPMIRSISDRVIAMIAGQAIASGPPAETLADPRVVDSYLGMHGAAVERSGGGLAAASAAASADRSANGDAASAPRCVATTLSGARCTRSAVDGELCRQHDRASAGVLR
jgi:ABC-type branched-subunit amino acid transport system ATPase component